MTNNRTLGNIFIIIISILPIVYVAMIWKTLPDIIPTHFGPSGKPDQYGSKSAIWLITSILAGASLFAYSLLTNIQKIDPKRYAQSNATVFNKLATGMVLFLTAINFIIISATMGNTNVINHALMPLMGLFFAFMGNLMHNIKPNYFAGIRLPWTLSSDDNWRKTHQLAGKIWFGAGILITVLSLIIPADAFTYVFMVFIVIIVLIPVIYSFTLFKQEQKSVDNR